MVDEVIMPEETRDRLVKAFAALENKQVQVYEKKHGNIAL